MAGLSGLLECYFYDCSLVHLDLNQVADAASPLRFDQNLTFLLQLSAHGPNTNNAPHYPFTSGSKRIPYIHYYTFKRHIKVISGATHLANWPVPSRFRKPKATPCFAGWLLSFHQDLAY